jgi:hypothetical protein
MSVKQWQVLQGAVVVALGFVLVPVLDRYAVEGLLLLAAVTVCLLVALSRERTEREAAQWWADECQKDLPTYDKRAMPKAFLDAWKRGGKIREALKRDCCIEPTR